MKRYYLYLKRFVMDRRVLLTFTALVVAACVSNITLRTSGTYVSHTPSITQNFSGVLSEQMLTDFCFQLRNVQGVTGVTYRDFSTARRTAMITVYYNPQETSVRQIRIFMQGSGVLWRKPKAT